MLFSDRFSKRQKYPFDRSAFIVKYSENSSQPISDGISSVIVSGSNESFKILPIFAISFGSLFTGGIS